MQNLGPLSSARFKSSVWSESCRKDVMQVVYNVGRFPVSLALSHVFYRDAVTIPSFKSDLPQNENLILLSHKCPEESTF